MKLNIKTNAHKHGVRPEQIRRWIKNFNQNLGSELLENAKKRGVMASNVLQIRRQRKDE